MRKVKSLLNKMSSPMRPPAWLGDLRLTKSFVSKVFSLFITTQSAEDSRQRRSGMTALLDVKAFTLVELLVVVLIIGILSAIAIPMYQGAVDKSHWSTMLPASKAIKDAEEAFKMTNGEYSDTMEHLDVQISNNDLTFTLNTPNNLADPNVIRVTNSKLGNNVRLASYLDDSPKFAGQLHCEAKTGDERSTKLCDKLLGGQELSTVGDYTGYLLDQAIDKATCENAERFYGQKTNTCYKTNGERCVGLGMPYNPSTQFCGYTSGNNHEINEGGVCTGSNACKDSDFYGATCKAGGNYACGLGSDFYEKSKCIDMSVDSQSNCRGAHFHSGSECISAGGESCGQSTFDNQSRCVANGSWWGSGYGGCFGSAFSNESECVANYNHACGRSTFTSGSKCIANAPGTCLVSGDWWNTVTYDGGCCEGPYCPSNAPAC